jgi:hypothetical protein
MVTILLQVYDQFLHFPHKIFLHPTRNYLSVWCNGNILDFCLECTQLESTDLPATVESFHGIPQSDWASIG